MQITQKQSWYYYYLFLEMKDKEIFLGKFYNIYVCFCATGFCGCGSPCW